MMSRIPRTGKVFDAPQAIAELHYKDTGAIEAEVDRLKRLAAAVKPSFPECFMTEPSPGIIATTMLNAHYQSHEAYLDAIAPKSVANTWRWSKRDLFCKSDLAMERVLL
jgi:5-methyltetrahydropteroyltriglutamate--homocysteine methyltransferase